MDFIERSNKILLFIAAIIVIIVIGQSIISDFLRKSDHDPKVKVVEHGDAQIEARKPKLEKRYVGKIKDVHILEVTSDSITEDKSYGSSADIAIVFSPSFGLSSNAVNLMFTKIGEKNHLLFETNALIVRFSPAYVEAGSNKNVLSKNIYLVAKNDTNKDGFLNQYDKKELLVSEYDGANLKPVMNNVEGYQLIENDMILVYAKGAGGTLYYTFNVLTGEIIQLDTDL